MAMGEELPLGLEVDNVLTLVLVNNSKTGDRVEYGTRGECTGMRLVAEIEADTALSVVAIWELAFDALSHTSIHRMLLDRQQAEGSS